MGHSWEEKRREEKRREEKRREEKRREEKCMHVLAGMPGRDYLLDTGVGRRVILKWILKQ